MNMSSRQLQPLPVIAPNATSTLDSRSHPRSNTCAFNIAYIPLMYCGLKNMVMEEKSIERFWWRSP